MNTLYVPLDAVSELIKEYNYDALLELPTIDLSIIDTMIEECKNDLNIDGGEDNEYCGRVEARRRGLQELKSRLSPKN